MKMKTIAASLFATLSMFSASAMAGSYNVAITGTPASYAATDLSSSVSFNGFNTSLGTLTGVSIEISALVDGNVKVTNWSDETKAGYVSLDVLLGFDTGTTAQTFYTGNLYYKTYSLDAGDHVTLSSTGTVAASTSYDTGLAYFTTASVFGTTGVKALSYTGGGEDVVTSFHTNVIASGTVTYTYAAAPVPEPETYGMLLVGLGLMGVVARRKISRSDA